MVVSGVELVALAVQSSDEGGDPPFWDAVTWKLFYTGNINVGNIFRGPEA